MCRLAFTLYFFLVFELFLAIVESDDLTNSALFGSKPFRTNKMNFVWRKAVNHVANDSLKRLFKDIAKFDELYIEAKDYDVKHMKYNSEQIDRKLEQQLEKYGISAAVNAFNEKMKWNGKNAEVMIKKPTNLLANFTDFTAQKLWKAVLKANVMENELEEFFVDIQLYDDMMKKYYEMIAKINIADDENFAGNELTYDESKNKDLKKHFATAQAKLKQVESRLKRIVESSFKDEKVRSLWAMASSKKDLPAEELAIIKSELSHLDRQLEKLKFHEQDVDISQKMTHKTAQSAAYSDDMRELSEEYQRMKRKLKKLEHSLTSKISHTEL